MDDHLVKALVDVAIFLEFSNQELLNEDLAVDMLEKLSSELQLINDDLRSELCEKIKDLSDKYEGIEKKVFVNKLPETLGIDY
ncbi:hypothetical protein R6242_03880 [Iodobacter sp. CM08]|uniref:hypothetical protein n=1 Tax=Iodobacter sp. CM08 TaxID=3085902 RepID=UPI002980ABD3|nr:hypothetical protein [Iodobacter sp. CM08]MDW5415708.1 hypothetical protein [Iodobacter sp. CM08]